MESNHEVDSLSFPKHGRLTCPADPMIRFSLPTSIQYQAVVFALVGAITTFAEETAKAPIWALSDEDSTVYLAGSVHLLRKQDMPIPPAFDAVYAQSEELVFELDMAEMMNPASAFQIRKQGTLPAGEFLSDHLSENTVAALKAYLKDQNMRVDMFDRFTPGMVYITLGSLEAIRHGARPELGLESTFFQRSVKDGKPSRGLETMEYQMARFNELEIATVDQLILDTLEEADNAEQALDEIIAAWKSGDPDQIAELIVDKMSEDADVQRILLTERNRNWIPEIEKALAGDKDTLFLVGAAHLAGENSVIELLREKGYEPRHLDAAP